MFPGPPRVFILVPRHFAITTRIRCLPGTVPRQGRGPLYCITYPHASLRSVRGALISSIHHGIYHVNDITERQEAFSEPSSRPTCAIAQLGASAPSFKRPIVVSDFWEVWLFSTPNAIFRTAYFGPEIPLLKPKNRSHSTPVPPASRSVSQSLPGSIAPFPTVDIVQSVQFLPCLPAVSCATMSSLSPRLSRANKPSPAERPVRLPQPLSAMLADQFWSASSSTCDASRPYHDNAHENKRRIHTRTTNNA